MENFEFYVEHEVLNYPEYRFLLDEYRRGSDTILLAHIKFNKFSPTIFKRVLREWSAFRQCVSAPIFAYYDDEDIGTWEHFVSRLGFKPTGINILCNNGKQRRLFASHGGQ